MKSNLKFVFFGTDTFSVGVLNELEKAGFVPNIVVCAPDRPSGRGHTIQSPIAKKWAETRSIKVIQPEKLDEQFVSILKQDTYDFFVVASYGKIINQTILDIPKKGTLNVHPSLLPLYRGASPIESAMLDDSKETGVTILLVDEKMDHGPILNQEFVFFEEWPKKIEVEDKLAQVGGELLAKTIPLWIDGTLDEQEQDHDTATFTKKITKEMGEININENSRLNFLKIQALNPWPGAYFFIDKEGEKIRVKITKASWKDDSLQIEKVIPEGKKEMDFGGFKRGYKLTTES